MSTFLTLTLAACFIVLVRSKVYDRCELARDLYQKYKFPKQDLPRWLCIAYWESSFDTAALHKGNWDGSTDHGLFQINDKFWCRGKTKYTSNTCNIPCDKLRNEDISDDVQCAVAMYRRHGFDAWVANKLKCNGDNSHFLKDCDLTTPQRRMGLFSSDTLRRTFAVHDSPHGYQINLKIPDTTLKFGGKLFNAYFRIRPFFSASKYGAKH